MAEEQENRNSGKTWLLVGFIILLLLVIAGQSYYTFVTQAGDIEEKEENIANLEEEKEKLNFSLDSLETELENALGRASELEGDTAQLKELLAQVRAEKNALANQVEGLRWKANQYNSLKAQVNLFKQQLAKAKGQIDSLQRANEELFAENSGLKEDKQKLKTSLDSLDNENMNLEQKVEVGKQIKTSNIKVTAVKKSGKEKYDDELRARWLDKMKVEVFLADNGIAETGNKEIYVRIINPDGEVQKDLATGSGSFEANGKDMFYSVKASHMFDNQSPVEPLYFQFEDRPEKGMYTIEVYTDGYKMGSKKFNVK